MTNPTAPNVYPFLRYKDAPAAIAWLKEGFGFEEQMVVPGEAGSIAHAQLRLGPGIVMVGTGPAAWDGTGQAPMSHGVYIAIPDPDSHHARAKAAGAVITWELHDTDYGSREYSCRDLEGNYWSFGTYQPIAGVVED
jgi:uncharacterized glyoxalase superfamily protein PhnB